MREFKFRVWDSYHQEMINWSKYKDELVSEDFINHGKGPLVVMQYTGLKDMKGKEIYEGDIVEFRPWRGEETENYIVKYISDDASFRGIKEKKSSIKVLSLINSEQGLKIIGNIFENLELVKGNLG